MKILSRAEEIILLAIVKLKGNAYGISIRNLIKEETKVEWSFAQIYDPLNKLFHKGYIQKLPGESTQERGGRPKCLYEITEAGKKVLSEIRRFQETMWQNISENALT